MEPDEGAMIQGLRLRFLLKHGTPQASVGIQPELKPDFPQLVKKLKRLLKVAVLF